MNDLNELHEALREEEEKLIVPVRERIEEISRLRRLLEDATEMADNQVVQHFLVKVMAAEMVARDLSLGDVHPLHFLKSEREKTQGDVEMPR